MAVSIVRVEHPQLFVGPAQAPQQVVRVTVAGPPGPVTVTVLSGRATAAIVAAELTVEVPVALPAGTPVGAEVPAVVTVSGPGGSARAEVLVPVAEPGWTAYLVPHFHYDPVWWTTQAAYTEAWDELTGPDSARQAFQLAGFDLVRAHLETARHDPDYRFVLAETDYLKPWWDSVPAERAFLRRLLAEGRCELVGGTYNEPNTNLTSVESTIRNLAYGIGLQRDVLGGAPETAWQLDAFGHDPQFPGLCAGAGLTASSWARGPFHQWGPMIGRGEEYGDARVMQFPSEFEWVAPSGTGLLTAYMPAHYSAGWWMDTAPTLADAQDAVLRLLRALQPVAATRNVLIPVGTDYSPPNKWVTAICRDWAARYSWPRLVCAVPRDFLAAVRSELAAEGRAAVPVSRDMNPIYTGKDVSYIDTKQAHRQAEVRVAEAERFATLAALHGARFPFAGLDGAWRQLLYGAHHDAVTGSEGDQVYLDLLAGWRDAWTAGGDVLRAAAADLVSQVDTSGPGVAVTVLNGLAWPRTDLVRVDPPAGDWSVVDGAGSPVPAVLEGRTLAFVARDLPATGWRTYRLVPGGTPGWAAATGTTAQNDAYRVTADPARGGTVSSWLDRRLGRELLPAGRVGNELLVYDEYPQHPSFGEGPWHLLPTGPPRAGTAGSAATVRAWTSPAGQRLVVTGELDGVGWEQALTVWSGLSRVDCTTRLRPAGSDRLLRLRWPTAVTGGLPVSEVGAAVIGRGFGVLDVDSAEHPWTLDNPAYSWFGVGSTARALAGDVATAVGVAEVVADASSVTGVRDLVVALVRAGVTSTTSLDTGSRYGALSVDSNLPDTRIAVGGPDRNAFTAAVLAAAPPWYAAELDRQLAATGRARVWVPALRPLPEVWEPSADLRGERTLPVLVLAGRDGDALAAAVAELVDDLADATVQVGRSPQATPALADFSVAMLSRGLPGFAVDRTGALHLSLARSCTGWPSAVWISKPRRTVPDGSGFQLQHWTHTFEYALTSGPGDWRSAGFVPAGQGFTAPPVAVVAPPHPGPLPATHSLLAVEPAGAAVVTAVKPPGTPLASGATPAPPAGAVAVRLYEAAGRCGPVRLRLAGGVAAASRADLLDRPTGPLPVLPDGSVQVPLEPCEVATVLLRPAAAVAGDRELVAEPAGVVPARYWLENAGPAPAGNLPVSVHVQPTRVSGPAEVRVSVASSLADTEWTGVVTVTAGDGWEVQPAAWPVAVPPGGWAETPLRVRPPADAAPGDHLVAVSLQHGGQVVRDLLQVTVPGPAPGPGVLDVHIDTLAVVLRPGRRGSVRVELASTYRSPLDTTLQLLGPVDTWPFVPQWTVPVRLAGDDRRRVELPIEVPAGAAAGEWWLLARLAGAGQVVYSESVPLTVHR